MLSGLCCCCGLLHFCVGYTFLNQDIIEYSKICPGESFLLKEFYTAMEESIRSFNIPGLSWEQEAPSPNTKCHVSDFKAHQETQSPVLTHVPTRLASAQALTSRPAMYWWPWSNSPQISPSVSIWIEMKRMWVQEIRYVDCVRGEPCGLFGLSYDP